MNNIKYVTLSDALFLGGKNHQMKVFNGKQGIEIEYDATKDHVLIYFGGEMATVKHYGTIVSTAQRIPKTESITNPTPRKPVKAQASSPHDHVFSDGPGKTRD